MANVLPHLNYRTLKWLVVTCYIFFISFLFYFIYKYICSEQKAGVDILLKDPITEWRFVITFVSGILILIYASDISHNILVYYITSSLTMIMMFLLATIIYLSTRNGKIITLGYVGFFWGLGTYFINQVIDTLNRPMTLKIIGVISVIFMVYSWWKGPPTNPRTYKIIEFLTIGIGICLIHTGVNCTILASGIIFVILLGRRFFTIYSLSWRIVVGQPLRILFFPFKLAVTVTRNLYQLFSPICVKPLTQEEYRLLGIRETRRSLHNLRNNILEMDGKDIVDILSRVKETKGLIRFLHGDTAHLSEYKN